MDNIDEIRNIEEKKRKKGINLMFLLFIIFCIIFLIRIFTDSEKLMALKKVYRKTKNAITRQINKWQNKEEALEINDEETAKENAEYRIEQLRQAVSKRQKRIIEAQKNKEVPKDLEDILSADRFIETLIFDKIISKEEGDTVSHHKVVINNRTFKIDDYEIVDNQIHDIDQNEILEADSSDEIKPVITLKLKGMFSANNEYIAKKNSTGKVVFDALKDSQTGEYVVNAKDIVDGDITNNIKVDYDVKPENWESGKVYKVMYSVENSRKQKTEKELKVIVLSTNE